MNLQSLGFKYGSSVFFTYYIMLIVVQIGLIPYDGVAGEMIVTVHPVVTSVYMILACAGITFAIACLIFNYTYRKTK